VRGKVLGFATDGGTISGEDGKRYAFEAAQWKGVRTPAQGEEVDFEVGDQGKASDVYSLRSGATVDFGAVGGQAKALLDSGATSPIGARLIALATGNPLFQLSLVVILSSFFLTFIKLGSAVAPGVTEMIPDRGIYRIINVNDLIDYLKLSLTSAANGLEQLAQLTSGSANPLVGATPSPLGDVRAAADNLRSAAGFSNLLYLVYLAPIGALAVTVQLVRQKNASLVALLTGAASIGSFGLLVLARSMIIGAVKKGGNPDAIAIASKAIAFGFGSYVILLCGVALIALSLGLIRLPQKA
jgi:hypothetical protein